MIIQFVPFSSVVQPGFWHAFSDRKIDTLKLSDAPIDISGSYSVGRSVTDRESGRVIDLGCTLSVTTDDSHSHNPFSVNVPGSLKNFNTIEHFKSADKPALFNAHAQRIWDHILSTRDSTLLNSFLLISFADLKKYKFYYWFAFPAFVAKPPWVSPNGWSSASDHFTPHQVYIHIYLNLLLLTTLSSPPSTPRSVLIQPLFPSSSSTTTPPSLP
jgi:ubiquitin-like modifier-activating enzyme ATG7